MAVEKRLPANKPADIGSGPYLAKVVGHLDPSFMGGLEVTILRSDGNVIGDAGQTYPVRYAPPFYGNTAFEFMGLNKDDFNDTQKSYGMWFVPPDIGVTVIVVFIDGDASQGYWTNCVPGRFMNQMVPAIGASSNVAFAPGDDVKYDVSSVPVGEINRRANNLEQSMEIDKIPKPVHPFADRLLNQGLLADDIRGAVKSTARRNVPSSIFGISTPGPLDRNGPRKFTGKLQSQSSTPVPVSRLGGSQFVMDDGDDRFQRRTSASDGPPDYADALSGDSGDPGIPKDEYTRLRTRTGHQILLHNSEDLIYIANSRGTAWIELTSDGKIEVFAEDSISMHTKQDLNILADRDINLEAGRNVNIKASAEYSKATPEDEKGKIKDANEFEAGRIQIESAFNTNVLVGANFKLQTLPYKDADDADQDGTLEISTSGHFKIDVAGPERSKNGPWPFEVYATGNINTTAELNTNIFSTINNSITAGLNNSFLAATHLETAAAIHMNGPPAIPAIPAFIISGVPEDAPETDPPSIIKPLPIWPNVIVDPAVSEWIGTRHIAPYVLNSIMRRVPMHEPWPFHENSLPTFVKPGFTDREGDHPPAEGE
jgi:hypothetical protein